ncbi:hypothetical protein CLV51_103490 [Chitinophaga niastensis]|uniref:Uncharacterized protein n=2 Tax=Chitinophaga niastensis TaxID=536980 RepID=A0A2P8HK08_CHINA|nr:hypothetical protein CLV51_103490 [Chitinophaga niastensis]
MHLAAQESRPGQPIKGIIVKGGKNPGGNISLTTNMGSSPSSGVSNALSFNPNVGLELFWGGFGIGADAGTFTSETDMDFGKYVAPLKGKDIFAISNTRSKWTSTYVLAGPQYTFRKRPGALALTLSLKGGITHRSTPELMVKDNISGSNVAAYTPPADEQKNVFTIKPGLNLAYGITSRLSVNANVQCLLQPTQKEAVITYKDLGNIDFSEDAKIVSAQISKQPYITSNTKGPDKYMSAGIGISYTFRKGRTDEGNAGKRRHYKGKVTRPGSFDFQVAPITDSTVTGGSASGAAEEKRTYTAGHKNEEQPAAKGITEKGVSRPHKQDVAFLNTLFIDNGNGKELDPKLFKQVTEDRDLKGMKVSFKKDHKIYKYLGDQDRIVEILKSANRPAGCKDCTTRECNGKVYECACVNSFCYCIICVEITKLSELAE